jgi:hypothetical protein
MAGQCLVGVGVYTAWNLLADPATTITPDNESTTHPKALLVDGNAGKPFRFLSDGTDRKVTFNLGSAKTAALMTLHGHNLGPGITSIELRHSTDNFSANDVLYARIAPLYKRAAMYAYVPGGISRQYWRVVFKGTNGSAIWIGEMTLSNPRVLLARPQQGGVRVEHHETHARHLTATGRKEVFEKTAWAVRYVAATFLGTLAARDEVVDEVYRANRGDLRPLLFIPRAPATVTLDGGGGQVFAATENVVVFGHLEPPDLIEDLPQGMPALARWTIGVQEDPFTDPLA